MSLLSPVFIAFFFALGLGIIAFLALPGRQRLSLGSAPGGPGFRDRLAQGLRQAGLFDQSPSIYLLIGVGLTILLAALAWLLLGELYFVVLAPVLVFAGWQLYISSRQRKFRSQTYEELIPFLNRISTAVKAGIPVQSAYMQAVDDSVALKPVLSDSAAKIAAGDEFIPALLETVPLLPLRMWATFVRQLELHEQVGGDLGRALQTTTEQLSKMQRLQAEARADFSVQQKQQRIIMLIVGAGIFSLFFLLPGGAERLATTFSSPAGIIMIVFGALIMVGGIIFLNKQIKDIDRKLNA